MVCKTKDYSDTSIESLMQKIIANGKLSRRDYMDLTSILLSDPQLSERDRCLINRVLDYVQIGRLKLID